MSDPWGLSTSARAADGTGHRDSVPTGERRRAWRATTAAVAVLAAGLLATEPSVAGTYVMRTCNVPGYAAAPIGPWSSKPTPDVAMVDGCVADRGLSFELSVSRNMTYPSTASLDLAVPADRATAIERVRVWASTRLSATAGLLSAEIRATQVSGAVNLGGLGDVAEVVNEVPIPERSTAVQLMLRCRGSDRPAIRALEYCVANEAAPLRIHGIEATIREDVPPTGSATGGSLLGDKLVSALRTLDYSTADQESGVARIEALLGGTIVAARDLGSRCAYADFAACPRSDRDTLVVDTRGVVDGRHALTLRTIDAAGNRHDESLGSIDVQNGSAAEPGGGIGLGAAGLAQLTAGFGGSLRPALIVPFGRRVAVRGRLTSSSGAAIARAQVDVFQRSTLAGANEVASGQAQTRADGRFTFKLAPRRPSRTVRLAYGAIASSPLLNIRVRAGASLKATLHGTVVRYSGRVLSRPLPRGGKLVRLEGRAPGFAWTKFATLRSDRLGRFAGRYRLRARRPGVRVQIRVRVPVERGYPYLTFTGRQVTLRVR